MHGRLFQERFKIKKIVLFLLISGLCLTPLFADLLQTEVEAGGVINLDSEKTYTGNCFIDKDTIINGNNALLWLQPDETFSVLRGASLEIKNFRIKDGAFLIFGSLDVSHDTSVILENVDFSDSVDNSIYAENAVVTVKESYFQSSSFGISLNNCIVKEISNSVFDACSLAGIHANATRIESLSGCRIENTPNGNAIYLENNSSLIFGSERNYLSNSGYGISAQDSSVTFSPDCLTLEGCGNALYLNNITSAVTLTGVSILNSRDNAIYFKPAGTDPTITMKRCILDGGENGISLPENATLKIIPDSAQGEKTTHIRNFKNGIVLGTGCSGLIQKSEITYCRGNAVFLSGCKNITFEDCLFRFNRNPSLSVFEKAYSISAGSVENLTVRRTNIIDSDKGIFANNGTSITVDECNVSNCPYFEGVGIHNYSAGIVKNSLFEKCQAGISVRNNSDADILNNRISRSVSLEDSQIKFGQGIFVQDNSHADIRNNQITDNDNEGIYLHTSTGTIFKNYIDHNGHVQCDGSGIFCDHSNFMIADNYIARNYMYGIMISGSPSVILRNEISRNNRGAILSTSYSEPEVRLNICNDNDKCINIGTHHSEITIQKTGTLSNVTGNSILNNSDTGIEVIDNAAAKIFGNLITKNDEYNINLYNGASVSLLRNILKTSNRGVLINYSDVTKADQNQITACLQEGAKNLDYVSIPDFRKNWWGDSSGPCNDINPLGEGCRTENVDASGWLTTSFAQSAVFQNVSMYAGESRLLENPGLTCIDLYAEASSDIHSGIATMFLSKQVNLFPLFTKTRDSMPLKAFFLNINAGWEMRNQTSRREIHITTDSFLNFPLSEICVEKYDLFTGNWIHTSHYIDSSENQVVVPVGDFTGAYLIHASTNHPAQSSDGDFISGFMMR